jgi:hypothetical protein
MGLGQVFYKVILPHLSSFITDSNTKSLSPYAGNITISLGLSYGDNIILSLSPVLYR